MEGMKLADHSNHSTGASACAVDHAAPGSSQSARPQATASGPCPKLARAAAGGRDVRLGGGVATLRQYLRAGLVDEMDLVLAKQASTGSRAAVARLSPCASARSGSR
jgi:dihydrofolate reductase